MRAGDGRDDSGHISIHDDELDSDLELKNNTKIWSDNIKYESYRLIENLQLHPVKH